MKNSPLKINIRDGSLIISIGIETLAWAASSENHGPLEQNVIKGRELEWAKEIKREMEFEDGDYNSSPRIIEFFDEMAKFASMRGSGALTKL